MLSGLFHRHFFLGCLIIFLGPTLAAQVSDETEREFYQVRNSYNNSYGSDYNLLNGRQYNLLYSSVSHPFYQSEGYRPGNLSLNGEDYKGIPLNYDIYKQQLILQYTTYSGQSNQLVLNNELIDGFGVEGKVFRKITLPAAGSRFFQVVSTGDIACFLYWEKKLFQSSSTSNTPYRYSKPSRDIYLYKTGEMYPIGGRSSFLALFDEAAWKEIKSFLRREKIHFRSASDETLGRLMDYCNHLTGKE